MDLKQTQISMINNGQIGKLIRHMFTLQNFDYMLVSQCFHISNDF